MNPELKRERRWFRALEIAECLFEDEGYHTEYLKDREIFKRRKWNVQPKDKRRSHFEVVSKGKS